MTLTDRDRKLMMLLIPVLVIGAYWMLLLSPKREHAAEAGETLVMQEQRRDAAQQRIDALTASRTSFAADYAELVRLGKAVPTAVDMPTILVQLEHAAAGTDIEFMRISAEEREAAPVPAAPPPPAPGAGDGSQPAAAGGAAAQSAPGSAAESAGNTVTDANATSAAADSGVDPADTATSQTAREGVLPVGGGVASGGVATGSAPGLETVPLSLEFVGNFFDLASFFHRVKRYVATSESNIHVRGRLVTIEGVEFTSEPDLFPKVRATLTATAYLAPLAQGATAGATPSGPPATPAAAEAASPVPTPPTATATP